VDGVLRNILNDLSLFLHLMLASPSRVLA